MPEQGRVFWHLTLRLPLGSVSLCYPLNGGLGLFSGPVDVSRDRDIFCNWGPVKEIAYETLYT